MPFVSKAQQRFLFSQKPAVAREFADKTPATAYSRLPEHKRQRERKHMRRMYERTAKQNHAAS